MQVLEIRDPLAYLAAQRAFDLLFIASVLQDQQELKVSEVVLCAQQLAPRYQLLYLGFEMLGMGMVLCGGK